jgi:hypothetical protein
MTSLERNQWVVVLLCSDKAWIFDEFFYCTQGTSHTLYLTLYVMSYEVIKLSYTIKSFSMILTLTALLYIDSVQKLNAAMPTLILEYTEGISHTLYLTVYVIYYQVIKVSYIIKSFSMILTLKAHLYIDYV